MKTNPCCLRVLLSLLVPAAVCAAPVAAVYPGPERLNVLYVCAPHSLPGASAAEKTLLESLCNLRLAAVPVPNAGGDHVLDVDGMMGQDPRMIGVRKATLLKELGKEWDAVCFVPGNAVGQIDAEVQKALAGVVGRGTPLIWFAGRLETGRRAYPAVDPGLAALLPYQEGGEIAAYEGQEPLAGTGLEQAGLTLGRGALPAANGFAVLHALPHGRSSALPFVAYRRFSKASVLGIQTGGGLFPTMKNEDVDGERLWAQALERLVRFARDGSVPPVLGVDVVEGPDARNTVRLVLTGPADTDVRIEQDDQRGGVWPLVDSVSLTGGTTQVNATLRPSPYAWQAIRAVPRAGAAATGTVFVRLHRPVEMNVTVLQQASAPAYETRARVAIDPGDFRGNAVLVVRTIDWAGRLVGFDQQELALEDGGQVENFLTARMQDTDSRAFIAWQKVVLASGRTVLACAEAPLYRYRPYELTEQMQVATWHCEAGTRLRAYRDVFLRHLKDLGFTAAFGAHGLDALERHNLRLYMEHQASTTLGVRAASFNADIAGYAERYQREGETRGYAVSHSKDPDGKPWPSSAMNLFSMGEESGYGRWSEAYPWRNEESAPEACNKWFRHFLQQQYDNDLAKLNNAWGKSYREWDDLNVRRKYAEPFGWMFMPPPRDLESNLTPYVDTHAFHEWYFEEYAKNMMAGLRRVNPVATWTLSYDFTFMQYPPTPLSNFYCAVPPEGVAVWHAFVRSRTPGAGNPFHLDWMFYEDEPMNNQFLRMGYALGCTYLSTWGHVFNGDLTPTRPGMIIARTMKRDLAATGAVTRSMRPHYDKRVGIYTFDSRWKLVRGRYGYFLHRNGPNDIALGAGPYKAPGASYTKPPEGPLYTALTASGYSPKYVQPDEFAACKVLFMPYVEAIDQDTADKLKQYVARGGTLIAFPVIAQYDEGGKPYPSYPGAGLDELFGFTAEREWCMGRYPVDFPGENAAKQAFADAWFRASGTEPTEAKQAELLQVDAPFYFKMPMRIGGDPCHYLPEGHEKLTNLAKDVVTVGRHEDGQPLFTYRTVGKGRAICFNVLLTWPSGLQIPVTEQRETFRQAIDQLVRRFGVEPDFELLNLRAYGEGLVDFVTAQFDLPGTELRVLSMFSDWRSRTADARLRLRSGYTTAYDLLANSPMTMLPGPDAVPEAVVTVRPGEWRLVALSKGAQAEPVLELPETAQAGTVVPVTIGTDGRSTCYGRIEVVNPAVGAEPIPEHSRDIVIAAGERHGLRLRLDERPGNWHVRFIDAISGVTAEQPIRVLPSEQGRLSARSIGYPSAPFVSTAEAARGPEITDGEFLGLLEQLSEIHLDARPPDKRRYSYFSYELDDSRQRCGQLLACVDWTAKAPALRDYLASGKHLYLVGEDLGLDPRSGLSTTPARHPRIVRALQALVTEHGCDLLQVSGNPDLRVIRKGRGMLVLDRRSPDSAGNSSLHIATWHRAWLSEMRRLGLLPGGGKTVFLPTGEETLRQWFEP